MKKKVLIIIGVLVLIAIGVFIFLYQKSSSKMVSPLTQTEQNQEGKLLVWEDPAGFKFSYPEEIKINPHEEDEENYAHLELTVDSHSGSILIWVKDTTYKEIADWVKKENSAGSAQVFDSELGGNPAKKLALNNPQKLVTATLDGNAIVLIEVYPQDSWWNETYNQILKSFEFIPLQGEEISAPAKVSGSSGQTSEGGIIDEGEEVVE